MTVPFLRADALVALPGIAHAFFTRAGGVSEGIYASLNGGRGSKDSPDLVRENRRRMAEALGVEDGRLATPHQVHSATALHTDHAWPTGEAPQADAVVVTVRGLAAGIATADCGPVLFADAEARVVAAAHAGWHGALGGVLEATIVEMESRGARRDRIHAVLGPCIRQESYEVGADFRERFSARDAAYDRFFTDGKPGHFQFDLGGFVAARLKAAGVGAVEDLGLDTYADETRFFSYRRATHKKEADYGRLIAAIALI